MKKTTRILAFVLIAAMLMAVAPFAYAADAMAFDATLELGQKKDVPLSRDKISYTLKITIPEDGEYAIWSESQHDTYLTVYDSYGDWYDSNDDSGYRNNFKLVIDGYEGDVYYLNVRYYSGAYKETFPVYFDKLVAPTGVIVEEYDDIFPSSSYSFDYYIVPMNAYDTEVQVTAQKGYIDGFGGNYFDYDSPDEAGEDTITFTFPEYPDMQPITHKIAVMEDTQTKVLTLDTPVCGVFPANITGMPATTLAFMGPTSHIYTFTAPKDGTYVFNVDASDGVVLTTVFDESTYVNYGKKTSLTYELEKNQDLIIGVMPPPTSSSSQDYISYTLTAKNGVPAKGVELSLMEQAYYYVGVQYLFAVAPSNPDGIMEEYEFSCSDETNAVPAPEVLPNILEVVFNKPGQYTITAKGKTSGKTDSITINVLNSEITLDKPCTIQLNKSVANYNYGDEGYMYFTAPEDGLYGFTFSNDKGVNVSFDGYYADDFVAIYLEKDEPLEFYPYIYQSGFAGTVNYTASVKVMEEAEGIVLPEKIEMHLGQVIYFTPTFTPEGSVGELPDIDIEDEDIVYSGSGGYDSYELQACGIGQTKVTIGDKQMTVIVKDYKIAELDKKYQINFGKDLSEDAYAFTAPSTGWYVTKAGSAYTEVYDLAKDDYAYYAYSRDNEGYYYLEKGNKYIIEVVDGFGKEEFSISKLNYATGIEFKQDTVTVYKGAPVPLDYSMLPANAMFEDFKKVTASVDGIVDLETGEALKAGTTVLTVETEYGHKANLTVVVVDACYRFATDLKLNKTELTLNVGSSDTLIATADIKDRKATFSVADETIATVDKDGKVVAKKAGETTVYAYCDNITVSCKVTVKDVPIKDTTKVFKDVKTGKWYVDAINYNYSYNFIAGVAANEFGVSTNVTRGMFITILARIAGVDTSNNNVTTKFTDVPSGKYYTAAIKWASENGIVNGMSATTFEPNSALQRQQLCVMIVNFANHQKVDIKAVEGAVNFSDAGNFAKWAKDAIAICQKADIVNGYNEGGKVLFKPTNTATRAEAAQILYKFHKDFMTK